MPAKIKRSAIHHSDSPRPRGADKRTFEKVYWPFIPVVLAFAILLPVSIQTGALSRFASHPLGKVLAYSTSESAGSMLVETNLQRQQNGEPSLKLNQQLSKAAMAKATDMAARNYWSHITPDGTPPWSFVAAAGYSYQKVGENLATGFINEEEAIKGWMASPPHRENLLDPGFSEVGFGFANAPHYTANSNGPSTIFVAFYGKPAKAPITLASRAIGSSTAPSSANSFLNLSSRQTSPIQVAFAKSQFGTWAPVGLGLVLIGIFTGLAIKHLRLVKRSLVSSEYYVWHHPLFDLSLLVFAGLVVILWQTIGLVQ